MIKQKAHIDTSDDNACPTQRNGVSIAVVVVAP